MASKLSIWNRALQRLGSEQLVDVTTNTKRARALDVAYEPVRDALLEQYPWTFAKTLMVLAADGTFNPEWKYANQYILPEDCLAVLEVDTDASFEVMIPKYSPFDASTIPSKPAILTNHSGALPVKYIARIANEQIYSPLFCELLAVNLAYECCEEITQSNSKKEALAIDQRQLNRTAKTTHSKQRSPTQMEDGSWWEVRN